MLGLGLGMGSAKDVTPALPGRLSAKLLTCVVLWSVHVRMAAEEPEHVDVRAYTLLLRTTRLLVRLSDEMPSRIEFGLVP
jgi:hypothetical protein